MKTSVRLALPLVASLALLACGQKSYTVSVTEPASARPAPSRRAEPLNRLRSSAERLRDSAAQARRSAQEPATGLTGSDAQPPQATGTSGSNEDLHATAPQVPPGPPPRPPAGAPEAAVARAPTSESGTSVDRDLPIDAIAIVIVIAAAAVAATALALRRRRSV